MLDVEFLPAVNLWIFWSLSCFFVSFVTSNYSQVDKLWSITPWVYMWMWVISNEFKAKVLLMTLLATIWGSRLTYNFNRRGGYKWPPWDGEEDYRWEHVKKFPLINQQKYPVRWQLFNLGFVCLYQHFILLMISSPTFIVLKETNGKLNLHDLFCTFIFVTGLVLEIMADNSQFVFQEEKHRKYKLIAQKKLKKTELNPMEADGFLSTGVWSLCRHPNYAGEQLMWISIYLFSTQVRFLNWSIVGILLLCSLFAPSVDLSEGITLKKYPNYDKYVKAKFKFLPLGGKYAAGSQN